MTGVFGKTAVDYWRRGFTVVPIEPQEKRPAKELIGWQGIISGPLSAAKKEDWLSRYTNYGIGLLLGTPIGGGFTLGAVDVDDDALVRVVTAILGPEICAKRGKKGATFFVRSAIADQLKSVQLRDPKKQGKIDILLIGKQTVIPPSIHPETGTPYLWMGKALLEVEPSNLPCLTVRTLKVLRLIVASEDAWALANGKSTHEAGVALSAKLVAIGCGDEEIHGIVAGLLPADYEGDSLLELPEWITSAREKGFGSLVNRPLDDLVAHMIEADLSPLVYAGRWLLAL